MRTPSSNNYKIEDVLRLFTSRGIHWEDHHPNVTERAVGICCPFCNDGSFHCGVFRDGCNWTCWRCGRSGSLWRLTQKLFGIGRDGLDNAIGMQQHDLEERSVLDRIRDILKDDEETEFGGVPPATVELPPSRPIEEGQVPAIVKQFLRRRRFALEDCIKHEARYSPMNVSGWSCRLILPIRMHGTLVSYQGRTLWPHDDRPRYINPHGPNCKSIGALYGMDDWPGGRMVLVEGPLDQWRIGPESLATMGCSFTKAQLSMLLMMRPSEIIVAWDTDAYVKGLQLGRDLITYFDVVKVLRLPNGKDPDDLGREEIDRLIDETRAL